MATHRPKISVILDPDVHRAAKAIAARERNSGAGGRPLSLSRWIERLVLRAVERDRRAAAAEAA